MSTVEGFSHGSAGDEVVLPPLRRQRAALDLGDPSDIEHAAHLWGRLARAAASLAARDPSGDHVALRTLALAAHELLDDLATEVTLAQARIGAIIGERNQDAADAAGASTALLDRRYAVRAAREAWYPCDAELEHAARQLDSAARLATSDGSAPPA